MKIGKTTTAVLSLILPLLCAEGVRALQQDITTGGTESSLLCRGRLDIEYGHDGSAIYRGVCTCADRNPNSRLEVQTEGFPSNVTSLQTPDGDMPLSGGTVDSAAMIKFVYRIRPVDCKAVFYPTIHAFNRLGEHALCSFEIHPVCNRPPVCDAGEVQLNIPCESEVTDVQFDGSGSYDPEGKQLLYHWSLDPDCTGSFNDDRSSQPVVSVNSSGPNNEVVDCDVDLVVSDGYYRRTCATRFSITQCQRDCEGTINGQKQYDECGVCGGDGSTCADCEGVPNGGKQYDECGVCGGDGSTCADCEGVPNGGKQVDVCGICGGDGTSCTDCAGEPFGSAKVDLCGVCVTNDKTPNESCTCSATDLRPEKLAVDISLWSLYRLTRIALNYLHKLNTKSGIPVNFDVRKEKKAVNDIYKETLTHSNFDIPEASLQCPQQLSCVEVESSSFLKGITSGAQMLKRIGFRALRGAKKNLGPTAKYRQIRRRLLHHKRLNRMGIKDIPGNLISKDSCGNGPIILAFPQEEPIER